jgi:4-aminobutyrate aminotransferase/(S)-3-amino-2-methylpropionate transaminase
VAFTRKTLQSIGTKEVKTKWRRIQTPIPAPKSLPLIEELRSVEPRSMMGVPPIIWHEAEGFLVRDPFGNQWIDLTSGIVATNTGHAHPAIVQAIRQALDDRLIYSYAFPTEKRSNLLQKLVDLSPIPDSKAILYSAGTEATECAIELMRKHGRSISPKKIGILSFEESYHGRTLSAKLSGGKAGPNDWVSRERVYHYQIPFPFSPACQWNQAASHVCDEVCFQRCLESLDQRGIVPDEIAGIIAEPMPGWTTYPIPPNFAKAMADWAKTHDILITFDEVQSGCGRTGKFFAFEHVGIIPDLITLGKGLSSSLPVSAVIGSQNLLDIPLPGEMSSTHGGNPVCVAAALANLEVIKNEDLVTASAQTGDILMARLKERLQDFSVYILSLDGRGLFISLHMTDPKTNEPAVELADAVVDEAVRRGVLMFATHRGFLKFVPPLNIDPEAALEAVDVVCDSIIDLIEKGI